MNRFEKSHVAPHPKILAQMKPEDRAAAKVATGPPKLEKKASLGAMRKALIEKKHDAKEVKKYFEEVISRMSVEEKDPEDD
jgi:hypothetical protein